MTISGKLSHRRLCRCDFPCRNRAYGFTILELLAAGSLFALLVLVLASISDHALKTWSRNERNSDLREAARTAISLIGSDLRQAVLPVYPSDPNSLQFVINPAGVTDRFRIRDAIFWQAPIATSQSRGDLAVVGYFVRKEGNTFTLCRFFINPDDPDYAIYDGGAPWVSDALLDARAPADEANDFEGIFLENVPGMWVIAYNDNAAAYPAYDSRVAHKFPARVEISLVLLDKAGAQRVAAGQVALPDARSYQSASDFLDGVPAEFRSHIETATISVIFQRNAPHTP